MNRRTFLHHTGFAATGLAFTPADFWVPHTDDWTPDPSGDSKRILNTLRDEPPCTAEVRTERGAPRLFLNGDEIPPFFALSTSLLPTATNYRQMGIPVLFPIIGTRSFWTGPDTYDWAALEDFLAQLLTRYPDAFFFLRLHLHSPPWWTEAHPDQLIRYGLPTPENRYDLLKRGQLDPIDGGHYMGSGSELREASPASPVWRRDTTAMLQSLVQFIDQSPLRSRVMGYFLMNGGTGEWNTFGAGFLPGYSAPMAEAAGPAPPPRERVFASYGLLRDPATERPVIDFYRNYHHVGAETVTHLAEGIKEVVPRPQICGTFYAYLMEVPRLQDAGYLASKIILESPDIDLLACPYTYQNTNVDGAERWESDMEDGAGNWLGRARGVGGDGAFRTMVASIRRHGKLFASEIDPSTYLDRSDSWRGIGGSGSTTEEGSIRILRRDIGKVFAEGVGGWLYDFGPHHGVESGWFGSPALIDAVRPLMTLLAERQQLDLSPVADVAIVPDPESFYATRHWLADKPWPGQGIRYTDFINHWFLNSQNRSLQRLGAPVDYLYRFDLTVEDAERYRMLLFPNAFLLAPDEVDALHAMLKGSGTTVLWYYAPGLLMPNQINLAQMERLTGFSFREIVEPGPLMIEIETESQQEGLPSAFGVKSPSSYHPRFAVHDADAEALGYWQDRTNDVAFARKAMDGWTSIYVGTAPLPAEWLRAIATEAGVSLWSSRPDVVGGTRSTGMLVASSDGMRTLTLPHPMASADGGPAQTTHTLDLSFGEVQLFKATV